VIAGDERVFWGALVKREITAGHNESNHPPHILVLPSWVSDADNLYAAVYFAEQALALQNQGVRVGYACVGQRSLHKFTPGKLRETHYQVSLGLETGLRTIRMHSWNTLVQTVRGGRIWARLCEYLVGRYIRDVGRPDVIHAHCSLWAGYAASGIRRRWGIPFVLTEHSSAFPTAQVRESARPYASRAIQDAARVIAVSRYQRDSLRAYAAGREILCIPNCVNTDFFTPGPPRPPGPFTFVTVCSLIPSKGVHVLLRAFAGLCLSGCDVRLEIVGIGPEEAALKQLAKELSIAPRVRFLGEQTRAGVRQAMWRAGGLVLASTVETFGVVLIEALSTGIPVTVTDCGGPRDIVHPGIGTIVPHGTPEALEGAMRAMLTHSYSAEAIRADTVRRFSSAVIANALKEVYAGVLAK
jgi:glycosyltransferase involved in cell wall biosynthesis